MCRFSTYGGSCLQYRLWSRPVIMHTSLYQSYPWVCENPPVGGFLCVEGLLTLVCRSEVGNSCRQKIVIQWLYFLTIPLQWTPPAWQNPGLISNQCKCPWVICRYVFILAINSTDSSNTLSNWNLKLTSLIQVTVIKHHVNGNVQIPKGTERY